MMMLALIRGAGRSAVSKRMICRTFAYAPMKKEALEVHYDHDGAYSQSDKRCSASLSLEQESIRSIRTAVQMQQLRLLNEQNASDRIHGYASPVADVTGAEGRLASEVLGLESMEAKAMQSAAAVAGDALSDVVSELIRSTKLERDALQAHLELCPMTEQLEDFILADASAMTAASQALVGALNNAIEDLVQFANLERKAFQMSLI